MSISIQGITPLPRTSLTALELGSHHIVLYYQGYDGKIHDQRYEKPKPGQMSSSKHAQIFRSSVTRPVPLYAPMAAVNYNGKALAFYLDSRNTIMKAEFREGIDDGIAQVEVIQQDWFNVQSACFSKLAALSVDGVGTWIYYQSDDKPGQILEIWNKASKPDPERPIQGVESRFTPMTVNVLEGTHIAATTMPSESGWETGSFFLQAPDMSLWESHWTGGDSGAWEDHLVLPPSDNTGPRTALAAARLPAGNIYLLYLTSANEIVSLYRPANSFNWHPPHPLGLFAIPASNLALVASKIDETLYIFYQKEIGRPIKMHAYKPSNHKEAFAAAN